MTVSSGALSPMPQPQRNPSGDELHSARRYRKTARSFVLVRNTNFSQQTTQSIFAAIFARDLRSGVIHMVPEHAQSYRPGKRPETRVREKNKGQSTSPQRSRLLSELE